MSDHDTLEGLTDDNFSGAKDLKGKLDNWIYKISEAHHGSLITDLDQLIK